MILSRMGTTFFRVVAGSTEILDYCGKEQENASQLLSKYEVYTDMCVAFVE